MKKIFLYVYNIVRFIFSFVTPISHLVVFILFYMSMYQYIFIFSLFVKTGTRVEYRRRVSNKIKYRLIIFVETFVDLFSFILTFEIFFIFPLFLFFDEEEIAIKEDSKYEVLHFIIITILLITVLVSFVFRYRYLFKINKDLQEINLTLVSYWSKKKINI